MSFYIGEIIKLRRKFFEAHKNGEYMEALIFGRKIIELYKENKDDHTLEYAKDAIALAMVYDDMCLYDKAVVCYEEGIEILKKFSEENNFYADSLNNLAIAYSNTKKFHEAVALHKKVLKIRERLLGKNNIDYIMSLYNIGNAYEDIYEYQEAISSHKDALARARRQVCFSLMDFADIYASLGRIYDKIGNYKESIAVYEKAIEIIEGENGEKNEYYITILLFLSSICQKAYFFDKAIFNCQKAIDIRKKRLKGQHLDYIANLNSLAMMYSKKGLNLRSIKIYEEVLDIIKGVLGENHVFYADAIHNLAKEHVENKDFQTAITLSKKAMYIKRNLVGKNHAQYGISLMSTGDVYEAMENFSEALVFYDKALKIFDEHYQNENLLCADAMMKIGMILSKQKKYQKAAKIFEDSLELRNKLNGKTEISYLIHLQVMGENYFKYGEYQKGVGCFWNIAEIQKRRYGNNHPEYAMAVFKLSKAYKEIGRTKDAVSACRDVEALERELLGEQSLKYQETVEELAHLNFLCERYAESIKLHRKNIDSQKDETKDEKKGIAKKYVLIAICYLKMGELKIAHEHYEKGLNLLEESNALSEKEYFDLLNEYGELYAKTTQNTQKTSEQDYKNIVMLIENYMTNVNSYGENDDRASESAFLIGCYYSRDRNFQNALDWFLKAKYNPKIPLYAKACCEEGKILLKMGVPKKAHEKFEEAMRYFEEYKDLSHIEHAEILGGLGDASHALLYDEQATEYYKKWSKIRKEFKITNDEDYFNRMKKFADALLVHSEFEKILECYNEIATHVKSEYGERTKFAYWLVKSAKIHLNLMSFNQAEKLLEKATEIYAENLGLNSILYGKNMERLGNLYYEKDEYEKARIALEMSYLIDDPEKEKRCFSKKSYNRLLEIYFKDKDMKKYVWLKFRQK